MKVKQFTVLLLASLLLASCASDAGSDTTVTTTAAVGETTTAAAETEDPNDRSNIKDNLPDNLDFGGRTFAIYVHPEAEKYSIGSEDHVGDIVNDAVVARNMAVEERLNIVLEPELQTSFDGSVISTMITAGDGSYDLFTGYQYELTKLVTGGGVCNLYDLENIDFDQPWWWVNYMSELELGEGSRFFAVGDYFLTALSYARTVFYNKDLYAEYYDNADGLYDMVLDGTWTLDRMSQIAREVYIDLNNDGKTDENDQLGYATYLTMSSVDPFVYGTDIEFSRRTDDGQVELTMMHNEAVSLAEKLVGFFWQAGSMSQFANGMENVNVFSRGKTMFLGNAMLATTEDLRDMDKNFGMIPYPKFDEAQTEYRSLVHDGAPIGFVNGSSENLDIAGTVLEALNAETYRAVTPVWYETALKIKYSRDDASSQMIDLIHDSITTNFIFAYNYALGDIGMIYRDLVTKNSTDYASSLEKREARAVKLLDRLYQSFSENS